MALYYFIGDYEPYDDGEYENNSLPSFSNNATLWPWINTFAPTNHQRNSHDTNAEATPPNNEHATTRAPADHQHTARSANAEAKAYARSTAHHEYENAEVPPLEPALDQEWKRMLGAKRADWPRRHRVTRYVIVQTPPQYAIVEVSPGGREGSEGSTDESGETRPETPAQEQEQGEQEREQSREDEQADKQGADAPPETSGGKTQAGKGGSRRGRGGRQQAKQKTQQGVWEGREGSADKSEPASSGSRVWDETNSRTRDKSTLLKALDQDEDGLLNARELLRYARRTGFAGAGEVWEAHYRRLCHECDGTPRTGIPLSSVSRALDDERSDLYCTTEDLARMTRWVWDARTDSDDDDGDDSGDEHITRRARGRRGGEEMGEFWRQFEAATGAGRWWWRGERPGWRPTVDRLVSRWGTAEGWIDWDGDESRLIDHMVFGIACMSMGRQEGVMDRKDLEECLRHMWRFVHTMSEEGAEVSEQRKLEAKLILQEEVERLRQ